MICDSCRFKRNCINGSWCSNKKLYMEHKSIKTCENYEEKGNKDIYRES